MNAPAEAEFETTKPAANPWMGRLLVITAAVLWSTSGFFAKAPVFDDWPVATRGPLLAFWRAVFAAGVFALLVRKIDWSWRLLPMVASFALMNWTYLNALVMCEDSSLAIWLQYTAPAWVFLMAWLFRGETPVASDWLLLGFATVGVAIILIVELSGTSRLGVFYGLASGLFFAGVVVSMRELRLMDAAWLVFLNHAVTVILFCPVAVSGNWPTGTQWWYLLLFGGVQMGLPYILFARGLKSISSYEASGISLLEPVLMPVWVYVAWRSSADYQFPANTTIIGATLIVCGLLVRYIAPGLSRR